MFQFLLLDSILDFEQKEAVIDYSQSPLISVNKKTLSLIKKASFLRVTPFSRDLRFAPVAKLRNWEFTFVNDQF